MATKKAEVKATELPKNDNPWEDIRSINLPRAPKGEAQNLFVSINGRGFQVPRGKPVDVPFPVYERIEILRAAEDAEYELQVAEDGTNENIGDDTAPMGKL